MEIIIRNYEKEFTATIPEDACISEVIESIGGLLIGCTFHPETIVDGMKDYIEDFLGYSDDKDSGN